MKKNLLVLAISSLLASCATKPSGDSLEYWRNSVPNNIDQIQLNNEQGLLIIYRELDISGNAVNVYINGDYQASLLPNAFTPIVLCPGSQNVGVSFSSNKKFGDRKQGNLVSLSPNSITYVKVSQQGVILNTEVVPTNVAKGVVDNLPKENQTVSRVIKKQCPLEIKQLSASFTGLFKFDTSSVINMNSKDGQRLSEFAEKVRSYSQDNIEYITVSGYTDPEGTTSYNQKLSNLRANAVAEKLKELNVTKPIKPTGYAEQSLVIDDCAKYSNQDERRSCNYPNRRVEVKVYGR